MSTATKEAQQTGLFFVSYGIIHSRPANGSPLSVETKQALVETAHDLRDELMGFDRVYYVGRDSSSVGSVLRDKPSVVNVAHELFDSAVHKGYSGDRISPFSGSLEYDDVNNVFAGPHRTDLSELVRRGLAVQVFRGYQDLLGRLVDRGNSKGQSNALLRIGNSRLAEALCLSGILQTGQEVQQGRVEALSFVTTTPHVFRVRVGSIDRLAGLGEEAQQFTPFNRIK